MPIKKLLIIFFIKIMICAAEAQEIKTTLSESESGIIWFRTIGTFVTKDNRLEYKTDAIDVRGDLSFPSGSGPFPSVILAHGCGGISAAVTEWASALKEWGYATLVLDSFGPRGLKNICAQLSALGWNHRIPDAYGALRILASHPKIDSKRIILMGFSHGATMALSASTIWAKTIFAPLGTPSFRAFFSFYPYCNTKYPERVFISAPMRIHTGELDDWTPAAPCVQLSKSLKDSGHDADISVYSGAHHGFDGVGNLVTRYSDAQNGSSCFSELQSISGPFSSQDELRRCMTRGATSGWSSRATEEARRNVKSQLENIIK